MAAPVETKVEIYRCVADEAEVLKFASILLAPLSATEKDYVMLVQPIARRKYNPLVPSAALKLARTIIEDADPKHFLKMLRRYEVTTNNTYMMQMKDGKEKPIPNDALVFYITVNPRSQYNALLKTLTDISEHVYKINAGHKLPPFPHVQSILKTHMHKCAALSRFVDIDFDVDHKDVPKQKTVMEFFEKEMLWPSIAMTICTRGGFHVLFHVSKLSGEQRQQMHIYGKKTKLFSVDNDSQVPIPGTYQGGHVVRMIPDLENHWRKICESVPTE